MDSHGDHAPHILGAPFASAPCQCVARHVPAPLEIEKHHIWPQEDQIRKHGKVVDRTTVPLCDVAHKNIHHAITRWLRGESSYLGNEYQRKIALQGYVKIRGSE